MHVVVINRAHSNKCSAAVVVCISTSLACYLLLPGLPPKRALLLAIHSVSIYPSCLCLAIRRTVQGLLLRSGVWGVVVPGVFVLRHAYVHTYIFTDN